MGGEEEFEAKKTARLQPRLCLKRETDAHFPCALVTPPGVLLQPQRGSCLLETWVMEWRGKIHPRRGGLHLGLSLEAGGSSRQKMSWHVEWAEGRDRERDEEMGLDA